MPLLLVSTIVIEFFDSRVGILMWGVRENATGRYDHEEDIDA